MGSRSKPAPIEVKILSLGAPERYAIRRLLAAALQELQPRCPGLLARIAEVSDSAEIGQYASALVLPTLVIDGRVVCSGRFPSREAVVGWLLEARKYGAARDRRRSRSEAAAAGSGRGRG